MTNAAAILTAATGSDKKANSVSMIITSVIGISLLLLLLLLKFITPIPAIPPDPEVISLEIGLQPGTGGDAEVQGGGSQGNTGEPGSQSSASNPESNPSTPSNDGAITANNPDNPAANPNSNPKTNSVDPDVAAAMQNFIKNKGKATIKLGGQGNGDAYTGGLGDGSGSDVGPKNGGDPGTSGGGGSNGHDKDGKYYRHIVSKPEIVNPTQEEGIVDVIIHVNREGTVTRVDIGAGGTTTNPVLQSVASQSAYKIKINADPNAPQSQAIHIDIKFTLR
jgi:hypothetical protein